LVSVPALGSSYDSWIHISLLLVGPGDWSSKAESFSDIIELSFYEAASSDYRF